MPELPNLGAPNGSTPFVDNPATLRSVVIALTGTGNLKELAVVPSILATATPGALDESAVGICSAGIAPGLDIPTAATGATGEIEGIVSGADVTPTGAFGTGATALGVTVPATP